jgi:hypothetical protein
VVEVKGRLAELLDERRLAAMDEGGVERRSFTISQTAALLALRRDHKQGQWAWTLKCLRAANLLSATASAGATWTDGDQSVVELEFIHPGFELAELELGDPLVGALAADLGLPFGELTREARLERWLALVGRALNFALAAKPVAVELSTAAGGRRWERRAEFAEQEDPYAMRVLPAAARRSGFTIRVFNEGRGLGAKFKGLFGADDPLEALAALWNRRLLAPPGEGDVPDISRGARSIAAIEVGELVELGSIARLGRSSEGGDLWLVREGVRLLRLDAALTSAGFDESLAGWVDCPGLRLTVDESDVVRDGAFDDLVSWIFDMQAHTFARDKNGSEVLWPETVESMVAASGRPMSLADLSAWIDQGRELLNVSPHRLAQVPAPMRARVLAIWPSSLRILRERFPEGRWVPLAALGSRPSLNPIDLSALGQGSFDPIALVRGSELPWSPLEGGEGEGKFGAGEFLRFDVDAYVHRFAGATLGSILVLSYGRRVAHTRDHTRTLPGLTLVVKLREFTSGRWVSADELRARPAIVEEIFARCATLVSEQGDGLLAQVLSGGGSWDTPFAQYQLGQLNGWRLGLRYREGQDGGLELTWKSHPALALEVAVDREGKVLTLEEVLERVRKVGFIPEARDNSKYPRLESDDPVRGPLRFRRGARELLRTLLGEEVILPMPFLVDAQPRVADAQEQRHLLAGTHLLREDRARAGEDARARMRVLGRVIVARALGEESHGLEGSRLLRRYDPRALSPTRQQSLRLLLSERERPGLAFPGAVSRKLGGPVIEVPPALAHLLYRHEGFVPALRGSIALGAGPSTSRGPRASGDQPRRRRAGPIVPLLKRRVDHEWAVGSLSVAADGISGGIALWSRGLEVGTLRLPEPAGRVRGRLWLTKRGRLARSAELQKEVAKLAHQLLLDAPHQRSLMVEGDPRREALGHLMDYLRGRELHFDHQVPLPEFESGLAASLRRMPVKVPIRGEALVDLLRNALGQRAPIEGAMLSWTLVELLEGRSKLELGNRNRWVKAARESSPAAFESAALVLDAVFRDPEWLAELRERTGPEGSRHRDWGLRSRWRLCARLLELSSSKGWDPGST